VSHLKTKNVEKVGGGKTSCGGGMTQRQTEIGGGKSRPREDKKDACGKKKKTKGFPTKQGGWATGERKSPESLPGNGRSQQKRKEKKKEEKENALYEGEKEAVGNGLLEGKKGKATFL